MEQLAQQLGVDEYDKRMENEAPQQASKKREEEVQNQIAVLQANLAAQQNKHATNQRNPRTRQ